MRLLPRNFLNDAETYEQSKCERECDGPGVEREALRRAGRFRRMTQLSLLIPRIVAGKCPYITSAESVPVTQNTTLLIEVRFGKDDEIQCSDA